MRDGDDEIVAASRLRRALREQRPRMALRMNLLQTALEKHEQRRDLRGS